MFITILTALTICQMQVPLSIVSSRPHPRQALRHDIDNIDISCRRTFHSAVNPRKAEAFEFCAGGYDSTGIFQALGLGCGVLAKPLKNRV
jgi:hypothetical protein